MNKYTLFTGILFGLILLYAVSGNCDVETSNTSVNKSKAIQPTEAKVIDAKEDLVKPDEAAIAQVNENYGKLPLYFIRNDGQIDKKVKFYEKGNGHSTYFTEEGVYLELTYSEPPPESHSEIDEPFHVVNISQRTEDGEVKNLPSQIPNLSECDVQADRNSEIVNRKSQIIKLVPLGANKDPEIVVENKQIGKVNYFIGNDSRKWKTNVPTYQAVVYKDVYDGIDMKFYGNNRQMEYDVIVKPGADPSLVQLSYEGIEGLSITGNGNLEIALREGSVIHKKPYCYQEIDGKRVEVAGEFKLLNSPAPARTAQSGGRTAKPGGKLTPLHQDIVGFENGKAGQETENSNLKSQIVNPQFTYGFQVASYDKKHPLIIDPVLSYSTYLGGSFIEKCYSIAVDGAGNMYIAGSTRSLDFPTTPNTYDRSFNTVSGHSGHDAFVTKLDASGSLSCSTYLGGDYVDHAMDIAVDGSGNMYVTGYTTSTNFPRLNAYGAYGNVLYGPQDAFVTKFDASGGLVYSTYLGGNSYEYGYGIAVDGEENAYVTGSTSSIYFPTTPNAYDIILGSPQDAFVTKLDSSGGLSYSTYLGGGMLRIRDIV